MKYNKSISKHCEKQSELDHIQKKTRYHIDESRTIYKETKNVEKDSAEKTFQNWLQ